MKQLPLHNTYTLLAIFLAPAKSKKTLNTLKNAIINEQIELGSLLLQANIQMCTPLWYSRLEQDGLLHHLPEDFQQFLQVIYAHFYPCSLIPVRTRHPLLSINIASEIS